MPELGFTIRLCLVRVKPFSENILFSGNAIFREGKRFHVFGCHKIHFTENALHAQFSTHFLNYKHVDNESIPHSFSKETKPSKKIHQIQSN